MTSFFTGLFRKSEQQVDQTNPLEKMFNGTQFETYSREYSDMHQAYILTDNKYFVKHMISILNTYKNNSEIVDRACELMGQFVVNTKAAVDVLYYNDSNIIFDAVLKVLESFEEKTVGTEFVVLTRPQHFEQNRMIRLFSCMNMQSHDFPKDKFLVNAAMVQSKETVEYLINNGAKISVQNLTEILCNKDDDSTSSVIFSSKVVTKRVVKLNSDKIYDVELAKLLVDNCNDFGSNIKQTQELINSLCKENVQGESLQYLVSKIGIEFVPAIAVFYAIKGKNTIIFDTIVTKDTIDLKNTGSDYCKEDPLLYACGTNNLELVKKLVKKLELTEERFNIANSVGITPKKIYELITKKQLVVDDFYNEESK